MFLPEPNRRAICRRAFDALYAQHSHSYQIPSLTGMLCHPLFVTLKEGCTNTNGHCNGKMRGCVGSMYPHRLEDGIAKYGIGASMDSRFPQVQQEEIAKLCVTVSLLSNFESVYPTTHYYAWDIGVHGIKIAFTRDNIKHSAVFLPTVAQENGWSHKTTLAHLVEKTGYKLPGIHTGELDSLLGSLDEFVRFQTTDHHMTHSEYVLLTQPHSQ